MSHEQRKVVTIQLFNPVNCIIDKKYCYNLSNGFCFGNPEKCKINNKAGYPKEVKDEK
jgi:hypothetical protein